MVFAIVAAELALLWHDRDWQGTLRTLATIVCVACVVWFALDLFYFVYANHYSDDVNWRGVNIKESGSSFLAGMAHTYNRISERVMASKVLPPVWWFLPGFIYRNVGLIGSAATALGTALLVREYLGGVVRGTPERRRVVTITLAFLAVLVVISLSFFQAARKLMPLYPALALAAVTGLERLAIWGASAVRRGGRQSRPVGLVLMGLSALTLLQAATFGPELLKSFHARRDVGYMREYLREHGITRVLVNPKDIAPLMAPIQSPIRGLERKWANSYEYIVLHRLFPGRGGERAGRTLDKICLRTPIVAFDNQVAVAMWWYEFPLKRSFMDPADPLTHRRALYKWRDVRPALQHSLIN